MQGTPYYYRIKSKYCCEEGIDIPILQSRSQKLRIERHQGHMAGMKEYVLNPWLSTWQNIASLMC